MRIRAHWLALLLSTLLINGCGFHLRGMEVDLADTVDSVELIDRSTDYILRSELERSLQEQGVSIVASADVQLQLLQSSKERRTSAYSSRAKSAEFELIKSSDFLIRAFGQTLLERRVEARRSYLYRETAAVGKNEEENMLWEEMNNDLARRILLALRGLSPQIRQLRATHEESLNNDEAEPAAAQSTPE